jgi:hypothetical protein
MPYVKQERRPALDAVLDELLKIDIDNVYIQKFILLLALEPNVWNWSWRLFVDDKIRPALLKAREINLLPNGDINYILFKYAKYHIEPSYNNYKNFMGCLYAVMEEMPLNYRNEIREAAEWIRIKILIPYEEKAIERNGDV